MKKMIVDFKHTDILDMADKVIDVMFIDAKKITKIPIEQALFYHAVCSYLIGALDKFLEQQNVAIENTVIYGMRNQSGRVQ